jgi:ABC-type uncharacterized transport system permease subunit
VKLDSEGVELLWLLATPLLWIIAILPSVLYGSITGTILGAIVATLKKRTSSILVICYGLLVCIVIAVLSHLLFQVHVDLSSLTHFVSSPYDDFYQTYFISLGLPTIIYILSGGWAAWFIYVRVKKNESNAA